MKDDEFKKHRSLAKVSLINELKAYKKIFEEGSKEKTETSSLTGYIYSFFKFSISDTLLAVDKFLSLLEGKVLTSNFNEKEIKVLSSFFNNELKQFFKENPFCNNIVQDAFYISDAIGKAKSEKNLTEGLSEVEEDDTVIISYNP